MFFPTRQILLPTNKLHDAVKYFRSNYSHRMSESNALCRVPLLFNASIRHGNIKAVPINCMHLSLHHRYFTKVAFRKFLADKKAHKGLSTQFLGTEKK